MKVLSAVYVNTFICSEKDELLPKVNNEVTGQAVNASQWASTVGCRALGARLIELVTVVG